MTFSKKQRLSFLVLVAMVMAGWFFQQGWQQLETEKPEFEPSPVPSSAPGSPVLGEISTEVSDPPGNSSSSGELATVVRVIDGDTIELTDGRKVRYIGIDTPETKAPGKPVECYGQAAADFNHQLVTNQRVRLEKDVSETDRYGRLLRYVYRDDELVNLVLVQQGFAVASSYPPDISKQELLRQAEAEARQAGRGLWSSCP